MEKNGQTHVLSEIQNKEPPASAGLKELWCFGRDPKDLLGTAAAAAEGGRDTGVLDDPMDLIRCNSYLAKHSGTQYKQAQLGTVGRR